MKTHWKKFHNPNYLGSYAFQPNERKVLTVKSAGMEVVTGESNRKEECLVIHFIEDEKPLICNATNSKSISKIAKSSYVEDWIGSKIEAFTCEVKAFGELMEAVRVKAPAIKPDLTKQHTAYAKVMEAVANGYTLAQIESKYNVSKEVWEDLQNGVA